MHHQIVWMRHGCHRLSVILFLGMVTITIFTKFPGQTDVVDRNVSRKQIIFQDQIQSLIRHKSKITIASNVKSTAEDGIQLQIKRIKPDKRKFPITFQDDPELVSFVRQSLHPPATSDVPYNLTKPHRIHFSQYNQSKYLTQELLKGMRDGFFVELGAHDGETHSNTLFLERELGWKGLLIEPHPESFQKLIMKRRKAFSINVGASLTKKSAISYFKKDVEIGLSRISNTTSNVINIQTIPLYTMLLALNVILVDFLSLDIEGDELKVLKTIPWEKMKVRVMCVEINHVEGGAPAVVPYMERQGYILIGLKDIDAWFANKDLLEQRLGRKLVKTYLEYHLVKLDYD